jgi:hypothetical protein
LFRRLPIIGLIVQVAAGVICGAPCAVLASTLVAGVTSGRLGIAIRAGFITVVTFGMAEFAQELLGGVGGSFDSGAASGSASNTSSPYVRLAQDTSGAVCDACTLPVLEVRAPELVAGTTPGLGGSGWQYISSAIHLGLTGASFIPILGSGFALLDAGVYALEREWVSAGISFTAAGIGLFSDAGVAKVSLAGLALVPRGVCYNGRVG